LIKKQLSKKSLDCTGGVHLVSPACINPCLPCLLGWNQPSHA